MKRESSLLLLTHLFPNPANPKLGTFFRNKALALKRVGCRVTVVAPVPSVPFPLGRLTRYRGNVFPDRSGEMEGIEIHYPRFVRPPGAWFRPYEGTSMHRASRALIRRLHERERFDAVIGGMLTNDGHAALLAGRELGIPAYSYAIGSDIHTYPKNEPAVANLTTRLFGELDGIFAVGPNFTTQIQEAYPSFRDKVRCNALGVDVTRFCPDRSGELWRELGFTEALRLALYVGDFSRAKGVEELMELIPKMRDERIGFVLVGKGALLEPLQQRIARGGGGYDRCRVFPYLDFSSLVRFYQNADFFLFPSHAEGSPTVLIEAIACGLPVIASDIPPNHDAVTEGENGRFFPVGDLSAMESAIRAHLESGERASFSEASRSHALRCFDQDQAARELVEEILAEPGGSADAT